MYSMMIPEVTAEAKEDEEFKNSKSRDNYAMCRMNGSICDTKVLEKSCQRKEELHHVDDVEIAYCRSTLLEENRHKKQ